MKRALSNRWATGLFLYHSACHIGDYLKDGKPISFVCCFSDLETYASVKSVVMLHYSIALLLNILVVIINLP